MSRSTDINSMTEDELRNAMVDSERKFAQVSQQINRLDDQIHYLRKLFRRAEKNHKHAIQYNLRMQLSISSGVKVMYHQYATSINTRIENIRLKINQWNASSHNSPETVEVETVDEFQSQGTELL